MDSALVQSLACSMQDLISNMPCHHSGVDGWLLCLVEAFNLIEFFAVVSLFGWLTFLVGTEDMIKRFEQEKESRMKFLGIVPKETGASKFEWRRTTSATLNIVNGYFIISFVFYGIAALADYFFEHYSVFGHYFDYAFAGLTAASFAIGTMILILPVVYLLLLDRRDSVFVQKKGYAFAFSTLIIVATLGFSLVLPRSPDGRLIIIIPCAIMITGFGWAMARKLTLWRFIQTIGWFILSLVVVVVFVVLNATHFAFP